uniref:OSJNBb0003B01.18 protein n=2 Tax=Oryza TaxID=4527 RepID=Q7XPG5_ORYSJ|nr:OSJNBb0003B01.18 [Oryza sativa Japonica Group]
MESGGCPYIHFRLYEDCQRMTSSYVQMVSDIKRHVSHLAAAENQGVVPIISAGQIFPGPAAGEAYCKYKTLVLPSVPNHNMHFVVVLHTPPNWAGGTREPQPKATKRSMLRTVVSISEAVRFRELLTRIVMGFAAGLYGPTLQPWVMLWPSLVPNTPTPRIFTTAFDDDHFKNWDVYCKLARAGAQGFAPGTRGFATYESLIAFLGACLH